MVASRVFARWSRQPDKRVIARVASTSRRAPEGHSACPPRADAGYPNSDLTICMGVFMPSKMTLVIVESFIQTPPRCWPRCPAMRQRLKQLAINPMPMTPADINKYVTAELSSNERLIRAAGIK